MKKEKRYLPPHGSQDENGKEILLRFQNVDISFGRGKNAKRVVRDVSFDIYKGETFSLVGESGSGKTTIGRAVIRINPCSAGQILYKGVPISGKISPGLNREVIRNIQMVFQDPAASLNERATVEDIVSEGLYNFRLYQNEADRTQKVEKIIRQVGLLPEHLSRYPHEFSGGQRQRIGIARAMVMEPELVIADEPISALDVSVRAQILNLMKKFQRQRNVTYLFIAHDLSVVRFISDRIGVIYRGRIVEIAAAEELFCYPLHPYTQSLISAIPIPDPILEKRKVIRPYEPTNRDDATERMENIGNDHYVMGTEQELAQYRAIRQKEEPICPMTFSDTPMKGEMIAATPHILPPPRYDTGSKWYALSSFFLPLPGLVAGWIFRRKDHVRNYKACKSGALAGFAVWGGMTGAFLLALLSSVL